MYRALGKPRPPGIAMVCDQGRYTADPREVDRHVREKWGQIYDVDPGEMAGIAEAFQAKYGECLYQAEEYQVGPVTTAQVWEAIQ